MEMQWQYFILYHLNFTAKFCVGGLVNRGLNLPVLLFLLEQEKEKICVSWAGEQYMQQQWQSSRMWRWASELSIKMKPRPTPHSFEKNINPQKRLVLNKDFYYGVMCGLGSWPGALK